MKTTDCTDILIAHCGLTPRELQSCRAYFWVKPNDNGSASAHRVVLGPYGVPNNLTNTDHTEAKDKADAK